MTETDLNHIEQELNLTLPQAYREMMQTGKFGAGYEGVQDFTGVASEVIEMTREARANGFFGAEWPLNFLVIGDDGAGDYYFTDVTKDRPAVYLADHELTSGKNRLVTKDTYDTFAGFFAFVEEYHEETARVIEDARKRPRRWNWWRLWKKIFR